uniref:Uncharacterized protein n=1 Tax=Attheya septentrionalis TaxID=420275 RepID=A0A7S2UMW8_9STRA|mmetsp:Transcript_5171/g.9079  ORF Transcript_5171/g.9079 Transcript_5171/m.9079 type:complete len:354 (+) Transcript_5171:68-1129(+)
MVSVCWTKLDQSPDPKHGVPCTRSSHGVSLVNNGTRLVVYGGETVARTPLGPLESTWVADCVVHDTAAVWQWKLVQQPTLSPPLRVGHAQASLVEGDGDIVYIFGGRMGIEMGESALNDLWKFHHTTETWTQITEFQGSPPEARSFHRMIAVGTDLYVFGGCGAKGRLADLHRFDTLTQTWQDLGASQLLRGRGGANLFHINDSSLAVIAGFAGEETSDGHFFVLSNGGGSWKKSLVDEVLLQDLRPRSVCVSGTLPELDIAFMFGGEVDPSEKGHEGAGGFENDLVVLDRQTGAVCQTIQAPENDNPWPEARGWSDGAVGPNNSLYVFGGLAGNDDSPSRLNDFWRCDFVKP